MNRRRKRRRDPSCSTIPRLGRVGLIETSGVENRRPEEHIRRMERERYIARSIQHWHVVRIGEDGQETVMEITDSEEAAIAEAARLDREAARGANDKPPEAT
jgi:hypothetical protein